MSRAVFADFRVGEPNRDQDLTRIMEDLAQASEDCLYKLLVGAGAFQPGMSRRTILERSQAFLKDAALIPELHLENDLLDNTVIHVSVGFRAVKIAPAPSSVPCEQCGGSKIDVGYDDMGTPVETPCKKCL